MTQADSTFTFATFTLDSKDLTKSAVTAVRVALGIGGTISLIVGLLMFFWPDRTAVGLTWLIGLYWLIAALVYLAIAIFAKGMKAGSRILDIVLGILMLLASIYLLVNPQQAAQVLGVFLGILIGILWVIEGIVTLAQSGDAPSRPWAIFFGLLGIAAGLVLFFSPLWGIQVLFILTGIALIVLGVIQIVRAFQFGRGMTFDETPTA